ncbi:MULTISPECIES: asparagine synthase (glutamine-hydrolyzing) [unclassified Roseateles]|uniref:asparagine synthase (glutamine-hydrolyzing) n=1 Tax=unclassified Roseateles TaxID=2626991 RepID=UPI0006FB769D|nr:MULTISPECIES: asparagine synthase (glutamine-hydrolyzing) [unclassified Roseateles]KQW42079.1 asparagine synthase [Pelomonas sp. Root405]KRA67682.1 asparagine synthase [Pelomonas sp. Root662]
MCGIAGILSISDVSQESLLGTAKAMSDALRHRGPDDDGQWADADNGIAFGHRRLAIVDLTPLGHQPMKSACGRYVLAYNGEIYNHLALRAEIGAWNWRGHSDTETLLACITLHGLQATLSKLVGMFAIALWDRERRELTLARDRMGEKPLYWGRLPSGDIAFGSELKALRAHPRWQGEIDRDALALYMRHNAIPAPYSVYRGVRKLRPGEWLTVKRDGTTRSGQYWDCITAARSGHASPLGLDDAQAVDALDAVLSAAVKDQMVADVPLGAFLSGGVDSSLIAAMMCRHASAPVRTFTIGFTESAYNEAHHAKAVAAHLGTDHTELYVSPEDALAVIPKLPAIYDEPFADSSQIPTFLVAEMARRHVTVALSGDAGDELFAGYNRYLLADRVWHRLARLPLAVRQVAAKAALGLSPGAWNALGGLLPATRAHGNIGDKVHKFAQTMLPAQTQAEMYRALVSHWSEPARTVLGATEPPTLLQLKRESFAGFSDIQYMSLLDQITYLPDDILVKVDRAAMAASLETRAPLLDHRVVEFAWRVPMHQKIRGGKGKWLMRELLYRDVPRELIERPKQGFAVPLDAWLRGPLRDWAADLIEPRALHRGGLFDVAEVQRRWQEHQSGKRNWQYQIWDVLMFQAWYRETSRDSGFEQCGASPAAEEACTT